MAIELATAYVSIIPDTSKIAPAINKSMAAVDKDAGIAGEKSGKTFAGRFTGMFKGIGPALGVSLGGAAVVSVFNSVTGAASEAEQAVGGVDAVFKENAGVIKEWAKSSAKDMGLSRTEYMKLSTVVGAGLKNKGLDDWVNKSNTLVGLGSDLSAMYGGSVTDAVDAVNAAVLRGEYDGIEKYGVSLSAAAIEAELLATGQEKVNGKFTDAQKTQAAYDLVMRQTADAQGAFGRESETAAGRQAILKASMDDLKTTVGDALLPAFSSGVNVISDFVVGMQDGTGAGGEFKDALVDIKDKAQEFGDKLVEVKDYIVEHEDAFKAIAGTITVLALPAIVSWGVSSAVAWGTSTAAAISGRIAAVAAHTANALGWARSAAAAVASGATTVAIWALYAVEAVKAGIVTTVQHGKMAVAWALSKAQAVASAVGMAAVWVAQHAIAVAGWAAHTAAMIAHRAVTLTVTVASKAMAAAQWLVNAALSANPIGIVIMALVALGAGLVLAYQKSETFRQIVDGAWKGIKTAAETVVKWFTDTAWPMLEKVWTAVSKGFTTAKDTIGKAWGGFKDLIAGPIKAAMSFINDFFIKPLNTLLSKVGVDFQIPLINISGDNGSRSSRGGNMQFASGGVIPGYSPGRDNHMFYSPTGGRLALSGGEAVMRPEWTRALGKRTIDAWNYAARVGGVDGVRRAMGFASGGIIGWIKKKGTDAIDLASSVGKVLSDPKGALLDFIQKGLSAIGTHPMAKALIAVAKKIAGGIASKISGAGGEDVSGRPGGAMGWRAIWALIKAVAPESRMTSNYRPGAITASGFPSKHGAGRAVDLVSSDMMATFNKIRGLRAWTELYYSPAEGKQLLNGRRHIPQGITRRMHYNHIHAAMARGGVIKPFVADSGVTLAPGVNVVHNKLGKPEPLARTDQGVGNIIHVHLEVDDLRALQTVEDFIERVDTLVSMQGVRR